MGLSSCLIHVLPTSIGPESLHLKCHIYQVPVLGDTCCGPLMNQNLVVWSRQKESERGKEANIPWFMQRTNKTLEQGLHRSQRHRASSQGGLESLGRKVSLAGLHAPKN